MSYQCGGSGCPGCSDCSRAPDTEAGRAAIEAVLDELALARDRGETDVVADLVDILIAMDEYPYETVPGNPNTVHRMVECYGARWHRWTGNVECPSCGADWRHAEHGPPFLRCTDIAKGDTTVTRCPDCNHEVIR